MYERASNESTKRKASQSKQTRARAPAPPPVHVRWLRSSKSAIVAATVCATLLSTGWRHTSTATVLGLAGQNLGSQGIYTRPRDKRSMVKLILFGCVCVFVCAVTVVRLFFHRRLRTHEQFICPLPLECFKTLSVCFKTLVPIQLLTF